MDVMPLALISFPNTNSINPVLTSQGGGVGGAGGGSARALFFPFQPAPFSSYPAAQKEPSKLPFSAIVDPFFSARCDNLFFRQTWLRKAGPILFVICFSGPPGGGGPRPGWKVERCWLGNPGVGPLWFKKVPATKDH